MYKSYIDKTDAKILQGIAVLIMVFHHVFSEPERIYDNFLRLPDAMSDIFLLIAKSGRCCVAIFAFVSGYAICKWAKKQSSTSVIKCYKKSLSQLIGFYKKYWLVFLVFVPIGILFFDFEYSLTSILKGAFLGQAYCGEWWYVYQYVLFMLIFPVAYFVINIFEHLIDTKRYWIIITIIGLLVLLLFSKIIFLSRYLIKALNFICQPYILIFVIAMLISKYEVYEWIDSRLHTRKYISLTVILMMSFFRVLLSQYSFHLYVDLLFTPVFVYFIISIFHGHNDSSLLKRLMILFGKYSTYIWLIHPFFLYYYLKSVGVFLRFPLFVFLWVLLCSLLLSVVFFYVWKQLNRFQSNLIQKFKKLSRQVANNKWTR